MKKVVYKWAIQNGFNRVNTGKLQSLWMETPGYCNLACSYCFASAGEKLKKDELLNFSEMEKVLIDAKRMGVNSFGIPGAGEPLLGTNKALTLRLLRKCAELEIFVSLFTTAEFITKELAEELFSLPVEVLVKCNSLTPSRQDSFVSDPSRNRIILGYGEKRNLGLAILINSGFANEKMCMETSGKKSRLALVTSVMDDENNQLSNLKDVLAIFRFCRENNIIFDCDSILKRGRGRSCALHTEDKHYKNTVLELKRIDKEEFGNEWEETQSYIAGPPCDRHHHHLYVTQYGEIHPCIGATEISLGNIKHSSLQNAWDSKEMGLVRSRCFGGVCGNECANFAKKKCNSCLGRRTTNLSNNFILENGYIDSIGCWNFRKKA